MRPVLLACALLVAPFAHADEPLIHEVQMAKPKAKVKAKTTDAGKSARVMPSKVAPAELQPTGGAAMPRVSKFQAFEPRRVARRDLKNASYNPRTIDKHARKKLTAILRKGLVEAITWNERTGNIVGGHQRVSILDSLEGTQEYALDVCVINVDDKREAEINIALNNPGAQGQYDQFKLAEMNLPALDLDAMGLDSMELQVILGDAYDGANLFSVEHAPAEVQQDMHDFAEMSAAPRAERKVTPQATASEEEEESDDAATPTALDETPEERVVRMKAEKAKYREISAERDDTEHYLVVNCRDRADREEFLASLGQDPNERYLSVEFLRSHLGIERKRA